MVSLFVSEGLSNVEFHCGKAEDVFPNILNAVVSPNVTAIVDPPRAGLRKYIETKMCTVLKTCCIKRFYLMNRFQSDPCHQESRASEEARLCCVQRQGSHGQLH